jgi:glycosyltransferase involved in cell wall biosynthesis
MRIAVVQHVGAGYYSEYLSSLIDEAAADAGYQVKTWSNSIPVFSQHIAEDAVVYIYIENAGAFTLKWWYAVKLPSILKKIKAQAVVDLNGITSSARLPHFIAVDQNIRAEKNMLLNAVSKVANKNFAESVSHAQQIIIYSENKKQVFNKDESAKNKLQVIRFTAPDNFRKFEWHEKIMIKATHADNNEYFLSILKDDDEENFILLLRAFSKFKKWQQSSMKLVLLPKYEAFEKHIFEKLRTYKYRDDVKLLENLEETQLVSVVASAHSFVHISSSFADLMVLAIALKCALPVITDNNADIEEYMVNAALYVKEKSFELFGEALINLYKDENLHAQLKEAAEKQAAIFNREEYKNKLWQYVQTAHA